MSNNDQNMYPNEPAGPADESGLLGEPNSPNNSGLVGEPNSPDNSGLVGSAQVDTAVGSGYGAGATPDSTGLAGSTGAYGSGSGTDTTGAYSASNTGTLDNTGGPSNTGVYGVPSSGPSNTSNTGTYGASNTASNTGAGNYTGQANTTGTDPYDAGLGAAGGIGQNSAELPDQQLLQPGYNPQVGDAGRLQDIERGAPNPGGYSGAPGQPGMPDQAGTLDQTTYSNRDNDNAPAGPDADMRPNDTADQTGY